MTDNLGDFIAVSDWWIHFICVICVFFVLASIGGLIHLVMKRVMKGPMCNSKASLLGKTVIITGGTSGLGRETAMELSLKGARIILACRDVARGHEIAGAIKSDTQGEFQVEHCDLASLSSVKQFAAKMLETESRVDILVNCAGVKDTPHWTTGDGFEYQLGVNFISHFLLTWLLLPVIKRTGPGSRIVNVSCSHHKRGHFDPDNLFSEPIKYRKRAAYASYVRESSGLLVSSLQALFYWPLLRPPNNAAQTILFCAIDETLDDQTGFYYEDCAISHASEEAESLASAEVLWRLTERELGIS